MSINESKSWSNLSKGTRVAKAWKSISWKEMRKLCAEDAN